MKRDFVVLVGNIAVASREIASYSFSFLNVIESRYIEKSGCHPRLARQRELALRRDARHFETGFGNEAEWSRRVKEDLTKFIPFLTWKCGVMFRGRILEIGAGAAWFSAELSKLSRVVEVVTTDFSPKLLKEQTPKISNCSGRTKARSRGCPRTFATWTFRTSTSISSSARRCCIAP